MLSVIARVKTRLAGDDATRTSGWRPDLNPLWLLILPVVLVLVGLLLTIVWLSLLQGVPGTPSAHFTWENFTRLYTDPYVVEALFNTVVYSLISVAIGLFFGTAIAWLVERTDLPGKGAIYT